MLRVIFCLVILAQVSAFASPDLKEYCGKVTKVTAAIVSNDQKLGDMAEITNRKGEKAQFFISDQSFLAAQTAFISNASTCVHYEFNRWSGISTAIAIVITK